MKVTPTRVCALTVAPANVVNVEALARFCVGLNFRRGSRSDGYRAIASGI
jgi:hypothetical protein